jgi:hypothetical protein
VKPIPAPSVAAHRSPWLTRQRLRQAALAAGALLGLYAVLVLVALLGGPRIGDSFLPLPGCGPDPATPVAGLEPSRIPTSGPTIPRGSETPVPTLPPTPGRTATLPPATTTGPVAATGHPTDGQPSTPCPTTQPVPEQVDHEEPTIPPATKVPPEPTTTTTTSDPTTQPTKPPVTNDPPPTTPTNPPPPPDEPEEPDDPGLVGGLLDVILGTIGL